MARTMTSPTSAPSDRKRGLTLVEMLVALLVIVILASILIPAISKAQRQAKRTRIAADLQTIAGALAMYKDTCGVYPQWDNDATGTYDNIGPAILGKALIGPGNEGTPPAAPSDPAQVKAGDCVLQGTNGYVALVNNPGTTYTGAPTKWAPFDATDGADGPGFRLRKNSAGVAQGSVTQPFLKPEAFKMHGCDIYDIAGHPILYFPVSPGKPNVRDQNTKAYIDRTAGQLAQAFFNVGGKNSTNTLLPFRHPGETDDSASLRRFQIMLGDLDCDGKIGTTETPIKVTDFLLYSAGVDNIDDDENGCYGPINYSPPAAPTADQIDQNRRQVEGCDDITNAQ